MDDNLEVFFCDLCNTSVPQQDLESGAAVRVNGRVLGTCCLGDIRGPTAARSGQRTGFAGVAVVLLAAVAGAVIFLDWRLSEELGEVQSQSRALEDRLDAQRDRFRVVEEQLGGLTTRADLAPLRESVGAVRAGLSASETRLRTSLDGSTRRLEALDRRLAGLEEGQRNQAAHFERMRTALRELGDDVAEVAEIAARPVALANPAAASAGSLDPELIAPAPSAGEGVPTELAHHVERLQDSDPGTRFEAVDKLIQARNPLVLAALIEMTADADPFVRRLTVEGLRDFRHPDSVDALIESLADAEGIVRHAAHASLRKLTGQTITFDPDGRREERRAGQRRWKEWWRKNRASFASAP